MRLLLREGIGYSKLSHFLAYVHVDLIVCFLDLISFRAMYTFVVFNEFFPFSMKWQKYYVYSLYDVVRLGNCKGGKFV